MLIVCEVLQLLEAEVVLGNRGRLVPGEDRVAAEGVGFHGQVHEREDEVGVEVVHERADGLVVLAEVLLGDLDRAADHFHAGEPGKRRHEPPVFRICLVRHVRESFSRHHSP